MEKMFKFVKRYFVHIMGVFLVIGLLQYFMGCGDVPEEMVVSESQEATEIK